MPELPDLPDQIRSWAERAAGGALDPVTPDEARGRPRSITDAPPPRRSRPMVAAAAVIALVVGAAAFLALRDDSGDGGRVVANGGETGDGPRPTVLPPEGGTATVRVRLEPIQGFFVEGFEVGLRFETGEGDVIASTLWTDAVTNSPSSASPPNLDDYYDFEVVQVVPAGSVVVRAEANVGAGPGPVVPDLAGDLPCRLPIELAAGDVVTVEVDFAQEPPFDESDCLRLLDVTPERPSDSSPDATTTTVVALAPTTTTAVAPAPTTSSVVAPSTSSAPGEGDDLAIGSRWYVDVDLVCEGFELSGWWVVDGGDVSSWQPPGERHEGGELTIDGPDRGTFRGDHAGTKVATFRRLGADEEPACVPIPR